MLDKMYITGFFLKLLLLSVVSWLLIHVFASLGIFLAFAYLVFWLISPNKMGLILQFAGNKQTNQNLRQTFRNTILIVLFTFVSLVIVYTENLVLQWITHDTFFQKASFLIESEKEYQVGQEFSMPVEITDLSTAVNTVRIDIKYDPLVIEVSDISTNGSFADVFIEKEIDNQIGYAMISGGLPYPGYIDGNPLFATFTFKCISPGLAKVDFLPSSMILANDGEGTNILTDLQPASYVIVSAKNGNDHILGDDAEHASVVVGEEKLEFFDESEDKIDKEFKVSDEKILGIQDSSQENAHTWGVLNFIKCIDTEIVEIWRDAYKQK